MVVWFVVIGLYALVTVLFVVAIRAFFKTKRMRGIALIVGVLCAGVLWVFLQPREGGAPAPEHVVAATMPDAGTPVATCPLAPEQCTAFDTACAALATSTSETVVSNVEVAKLALNTVLSSQRWIHDRFVIFERHGLEALFAACGIDDARAVQLLLAYAAVAKREDPRGGPTPVSRVLYRERDTVCTYAAMHAQLIADQPWTDTDRASWAARCMTFLAMPPNEPIPPSAPRASARAVARAAPDVRESPLDIRALDIEDEHTPLAASVDAAHAALGAIDRAAHPTALVPPPVPVAPSPVVAVPASPARVSGSCARIHMLRAPPHMTAEEQRGSAWVEYGLLMSTCTTEDAPWTSSDISRDRQTWIDTYVLSFLTLDLRRTSPFRSTHPAEFQRIQQVWNLM